MNEGYFVITPVKDKKDAVKIVLEHSDKGIGSFCFEGKIDDLARRLDLEG